MSIEAQNITFKPVVPCSSLYADVEDLLSSSFPIDERRTCKQQKLLFDSACNFLSCAILFSEDFVGLINYWIFERFCFIEHFAIRQELRGSGLGSISISNLIMFLKMPVVIEVEQPKTPQAISRIRFYQKQGFCLWSNSKYIQPAYSANSEEVPMMIMVHGELDEVLDYERIKQTLYEKVYRR